MEYLLVPAIVICLLSLAMNQGKTREQILAERRAVRQNIYVRCGCGILIGKWGWPVIFFINLPIGIFGIVNSQAVLRAEERGPKQYFDIPGALLLLFSLLSFALGLSNGPELGWRSPIIISLLVGWVVFGIAFIRREQSIEQPILDLTLLKNRLFAAASASAYINYIANFAVVFMMPFYMSGVLRYAPQKMGMTLTAVPITVALVAPLSGSLSDKIGSRVLGSVGLGIVTIGLLLCSRLGAHPTHLQVLTALAVMGFGTAVFQSPNSSALMGSVPVSRLGVASGMLATMRNLGMISGIALTSAVYASRLHYYSHLLSAPDAAVRAFHDAFVVAAVVCALGIIASVSRGSRAVISHQ